MVALAGVLVFGVLGGLLLAVAISILLLLDRLSRPASTVRAEPGRLVFRLDAPLLFVNAKLVRDRVRELLAAAPEPVRIVLLDLRFTHDLDVEDINVLAALHAELAGRGVELWLGNVRALVLERLRHSGLADRRRSPPLPRPGRRRARPPGRPGRLTALSAPGGCGRRTPAPCGSWAPGDRWR